MDIEKFSHLQAIEFKTDALDILRGPGVYVYCEGDLALYVGASKRVSGRVLARNHHIGKGLEAATSLLIFPCENWKQARELEDEIIAELRPRLNMRSLTNAPAKRAARLLGNTTQATQRMYLTSKPA